MAKKKPVAEEEAAYNYMDTYGDMVTLLLTFFVLLFAFSSVDTVKWNDLVLSFTGSPPLETITAIDMLAMPTFNDALPQIMTDLPSNDNKEQISGVGEIDEDGALIRIPISSLEDDTIEISEELKTLLTSPELIEIEQQFDALYEQLVAYIRVEGLEDMLFASRDEDSIYLRVTAGVLLDSGRANLREEAEPLLNDLALMLTQAEGGVANVVVEGHTDNRPIDTYLFEDNWDLSVKRATTVTRFLLENGTMPPEQYACSGYGEFRPIEDNATEEGRQMNRRVEFVLERKTLTLEDIQ